MILRITLSEDDLKRAVTEYLKRDGYQNITAVSFNRDGYPDSPDPREQKLTYTASATVEK